MDSNRSSSLDDDTSTQGRDQRMCLKPHSYGTTNVGCVRENNEDAFLADDDLGLYIVCDGLGGHRDGEIASQSAINAIAEHLNGRALHTIGGRLTHSTRPLFDLVESAILKADQAISAESNDPHGMGTTVAIMLIQNDIAVIAHCGDTRVYQIGEGLVQLTNDHTFAEDLMRAGIVLEDSSLMAKYAHTLTRCLGRGKAHPEIRILQVSAGDRFLLCSDGLSRYLDDALVSDFSAPADCVECVHQLVELALEQGGRDNVTALVVDVKSSTASRCASTPFRNRRS